jgi:hypothetical protein
MLSLFGLEEGLPDASDVYPLLARVMVTERSEGDWLLLDVPLGFVEEDAAESGESIYYLDSNYQVVWRGFHRLPPIGEDGTPRTPTPGERAEEQRLSRLAETAKAISDETGCSQAEAVVFLLCREKPGLPYVQVSHSPQHGGLLIAVRDRRVPAKDVAAFYRFQRDVAGRPPRQPQEGPYRVVHFVEEAHRTDPGISWPALFEQFERQYPGRYGSMKSFQQTYYSKRQRT